MHRLFTDGPMGYRIVRIGRIGEEL
jgi:hypothetical protein